MHLGIPYLILESEPPAPIGRNIFNWRFHFGSSLNTFLTHSSIVKIPNSQLEGQALYTRPPHSYIYTPLGMVWEGQWNRRGRARDNARVWQGLFCKYIIDIGEKDRNWPGWQRAAVHRHSLDSLHTINDSLKKISQYPSGGIFFEIFFSSTCKDIDAFIHSP